MPESAAARRARARAVLERLRRAYPDAALALRFSTPLELLVATILSAQCTDERVNAVTAELFPRYRTAGDWAAVPRPTLESLIHSTGFFRAKARALSNMAHALVERHGGEVPRTAEELTALPGVGRKTASIVLGNAFGVPALAVDTHVARVSQRLRLTRAEDPDVIQDELCAIVPRPSWTRATHLLIVHGRRTCQARRPDCPACPVERLCPWEGKRAAPPRGARAAVPPRRAHRGRRRSG
ncbi:MAG: endonuclease III [Candidatus Rokubacteria bacterium]|nr:endonuclease III [Candidatus Rokubacteria bacterium]